MLKISFFHTNTHRETFAPFINCVDDALLKTIRRSSDASVHQRHKLGRPATAFLPIFCGQVGSDRCCWVAKGMVK